MGYVAILLMGVVLGTLGGGGGILAVPILVSLFGVPPVTATGESLFIVGIASAVGAYQAFRARQYEVKEALILAVAGLAGAVLARATVVPAIPAQVLGMEKGDFLLTLLAVVMIASGLRMVWPAGTSAPEPIEGHENRFAAAVAGLAIGLLSGAIGAGGGFLIVPVLTLLLRMDIKRAVPSSLFVISVQSLGGFAGELTHSVDWPHLMPIVATALVGMGIGGWIRPRLASEQLKPMFATLVFAVAIYLFVRVSG